MMFTTCHSHKRVSIIRVARDLCTTAPLAAEERHCLGRRVAAKLSELEDGGTLMARAAVIP